jgi:hypothetical protein
MSGKEELIIHRLHDCNILETPRAFTRKLSELINELEREDQYTKNHMHYLMQIQFRNTILKEIPLIIIIINELFKNN